MPGAFVRFADFTEVGVLWPVLAVLLAAIAYRLVLRRLDRTGAGYSQR